MSADAGSNPDLSTHTRTLTDRAATRRAELRQRADEVEANRKLPQDLAETLAADGFYAMCNPPEAGGSGATPREYAGAIEALARGDASPAWCAFIATTAAYAMATRQTDSVTSILNEPGVITAGVFAPMGRATPASRNGTDGFRINGRWAWGSNAQNARWIMAGCLQADENGAVKIGESGQPQHLSPIFAAADVEFIDTWTVSGLQGTGSTDFQVTDVFVPEDRIVRDFDNARDDFPIFRFPGFGLLAMGIAAVALGTARGAMDDFLEIAGAKVPSGGRNPLASKSMAHRDAARAEAAIRQGLSLIHI